MGCCLPAPSLTGSSRQGKREAVNPEFEHCRLSSLKEQVILPAQPRHSEGDALHLTDVKVYI